MAISHFSSIGLPIDSDDDLITLAHRVSSETGLIETRHGIYAHWRGESGAELWLQLSLERELVGVNPHFDGGALMRVGLTDTLRRPPIALDGAFHGWAEPRDEIPTRGAHELIFECPSYRMHDDIELPSIGVVQLAAFAHDLRIYDSVEEYEEESWGTVGAPPSQAFIPSGMSVRRPGVPPALALISGHIRRAERLVNELSGRPFYWLSLRSIAGVFDVVADPALVTREPTFGGVVAGSFWVSGKLVEYRRRRPSFVRRLLARDAATKAGKAGS